MNTNSNDLRIKVSLQNITVGLIKRCINRYLQKKRKHLYLFFTIFQYIFLKIQDKHSYLNNVD